MQVSNILALMFSKISSNFSVETILKRNSVCVGVQGLVGGRLQEDQEEGFSGNPG